MTTKPAYHDGPATIYLADCIALMRELPANSVDSVVTDPPYGLEFMGKEWDRPWQNRGENPAGAGFTAGGFATGNGYANRQTPSYGKSWSNKRCTKCGHIASGGSPCTCPEPEWVTERGDTAAPMRAFQAWCTEWATEAYRVLKPGGHLLAFGGTRTFHRLTAGIEDAGFEIRDSIAWMYGSGFPKSLDVSKAIDKAAGADRQDVYDGREPVTSNTVLGLGLGLGLVERRPVTDAAHEWQGWGTALKPAYEPITVARKPLDTTVAGNVLKWGTGALNIDGSRITTSSADAKAMERANTPGSGRFKASRAEAGAMGRTNPGVPLDTTQGRWPANVVLDEHQATQLDTQSGTRTSGILEAHHARRPKEEHIFGDFGAVEGQRGYGDTGGASRFFKVVTDLDNLPAPFRYEAKAPGTERPNVDGTSHATVKPLDLMRWLVKLVTPPGGTVLEPFAGSGTTVEACVLEGFRCIAIERESDYLPLILQRIRKPHHVGLDLGDLGDLEPAETPQQRPTRPAARTFDAKPEGDPIHIEGFDFGDWDGAA